jgi:hypothetical protein
MAGRLAPHEVERESGSIFDRKGALGERRPITLVRAESLLRHELDLLGARQVNVTAGGDAAAVYFTRGDQPFVMAVDRFDTDAANLRLIGLAIAAMRTLERHGAALVGSSPRRIFGTSGAAFVLGRSWDRGRR